ncbi:MAG: hypothetical protein QW206_02920 [Acidilobaceae archaeon]
MPVEILLVPIGVSVQLLELVRRAIEEELDEEFIVKVFLWSLRLDYRRSFNWSRGQLKAWKVNEEVSEALSDYLRSPLKLVVAVCAGDAYYDDLNFVFGLANPKLGVASVYIARLSEESPEKLVERLAKEVLHEIGHLLRLSHCENECVMKFSNTLSDVDKKPRGFCSKCSNILKKTLSEAKT